MGLDRDQLAAVNERGNVVVSAGAGSGKTRVLTERYIQLILDGRTEVTRVLTLTFTRKAAAEMFERIHARLREESHNRPDVARQLKHIDDAPISTLDSFCSGIVRDVAGRFGLPEQFQTDERQLLEQARRIAVRFLYRQQQSPALARLIVAFGFGRILNELLVSLAQQTFRLARPVDFAGLWPRQKQWLVDRIAELEDQLNADVAALVGLSVPTPSVRKAQDALRRAGDNPSEADSGSSSLSALQPVCDVFATTRKPSVGKAKSTADGEAFGELWDRCKTACAERTNLVAAMGLEGELTELYRLLAGYQEEVLNTRRRTGFVGHTEVMELAVQALLEDPELRTLYAGQFDFIMIDEFQDNNRTQRDLLFLLAGKPEAAEAGRIPEPEELVPDKLFFVGDEKQSIYRFRGADVGVFKTLSRDIARSRDDGGAGRLALQWNYRSEPDLIAFFNACFPDVFGTPEREYDAVFQPLEHREASEGIRPSVVVALAGTDQTAGTDRAAEPGPDNETAGAHQAAGPGPEDQTAGTDRASDAGSNDQTAGTDRAERPDDENPATDTLLDDINAEAVWIAQEISKIVRAGSLPVPDGNGGNRPATYGDMAILMKAASGQHYYERALRNRGIPYQTQAARSLFTEAPANDIYSFLQLLVFPEDRIAYAAVLRSPLCGLSDEGFLEVLGQYVGGDAGTGEDRLAQEPSGQNGLGNDRSGNDRSGQIELGFDATRLRTCPFEPVDLSDPADRERYRATGEAYRYLGELVDVVPATELLSRLWYDLGYRYTVLHRERYHGFLEHYDYLFELARGFDELPLAVFLDRIRDEMGENRKLDDAEVYEARDAVQLMTVHKSKGLEFPVVFVVDIWRTGRNGGGDLFWESEDTGLTLALPANENEGATRSGSQQRKLLNPFEQHARAEEQRKEAAELRRLLYVAATRSEAHLYFTSAVKRRGGTAGSGGPRSFWHLLQPALGLDPEEGTVASHVEPFVRFERIPPVPESDVHRIRNVGMERPVQAVEAAAARATVVKREPIATDAAATALNRVWLALIGESGPSGSDGTGDVSTASATDAAGAPPSATDGTNATGAPPSATDAAGAPPERSGDETYATTLGTIVHRLIEEEILGHNPVTGFTGDEHWLDPYRTQFGLKEWERILTEAPELAQRFLTSPWWRETRNRAVTVEPEVAFVLGLDIAGAEHAGRAAADTDKATGGEEPSERPVGTPTHPVRPPTHPVRPPAHPVRPPAHPAGPPTHTHRDTFYVHGRLDLVVRTKDQTLVLDFKTDTTVEPHLYDMQMAVYREAAGDLFGAPVEVGLLYLRHEPAPVFVAAKLADLPIADVVGQYRNNMVI